MNSTARDADVDGVPRRRYRMRARGKSVARTREQVLEVAYRLWLEHPYDEVTLERIADAAAVTRQTVHRQFGSKDDLFVAVIEWRRPRESSQSDSVEPGDVAGFVRVQIDRYEEMGDALVRFLALEGRIDAVDRLLALGRSEHRREIERALEPFLPSERAPEREQAVLALYAATDVMVWKLLRRDLSRSRDEATAVMRRLVDGVLFTLPEPTMGGTP